MNIFQGWSVYRRSPNSHSHNSHYQNSHRQNHSYSRFSLVGSIAGGVAIALTAPLISQSVWAATLSSWSYDPASHEFQVTLPEAVTPRYFLMAEPARIVVDLPGVEVGAVQTQASYSGAVSQIRVAQFEAGLARVVIELAPGTVLDPKQVELRRSGDHWVLRPLIAGSTATATPVAVQPTVNEPSEAELTAVEPADLASTNPEPENPASPVAALNTPVTPPSPSSQLGQLDQPIVPLPTVTGTDPNTHHSSLTVAESLSEITETTAPTVSVEDDLTAEVQGIDLPVDLPPEMATEAVSVAPIEITVPEPSQASTAQSTERAEVADEAAPTVSVPEPSQVSLSDVAEDAEAAEDASLVANTPASTPTSDAEESAPNSPTMQARVTVPDLPVVNEASESSAAPAVSSENRSTAALPVPTVTAQRPADLPDANDLPSVTFPTPTLPSGNGQVRVPAPTAPRVQPAPATAANLDTTEATGSAADLVLPATGIATQRPGGFANSSVQAPVASTGVVRVPDLPPLPSATRPTATAPATAPASSVAATATPSATSASSNDRSVTFGQPLPERQPGQPVATVDANVWLPADTVLQLQYPRDQELALDPQLNWQEVLVLNQAVVHPQTGQVILPVGTQVVGRFETNRQGSRFIAQAVSVGNHNVKLTAESGSIDGDRDISDQELLRNSGIGAAAATVLGGFSGIGLLAGLAAGAATTYVTAPQPAVIQPYQVIEVRVLEDITRSQIAQLQ